MDELVQYYVVNKELNMSKGKMSAQVAHGATISAVMLSEQETFQKWYEKDQKKIILQGKEKDLHKILSNVTYSFMVTDNGLTEIPKGSKTVVVLPPMKKSEAQKYVKRLQLFKG